MDRQPRDRCGPQIGVGCMRKIACVEAVLPGTGGLALRSAASLWHVTRGPFFSFRSAALITVGETIGVYDMRGALPAVRQVQVLPSGVLPLGLDEALPLEAMLLPAC